MDAMSLLLLVMALLIGAGAGAVVMRAVGRSGQQVADVRGEARRTEELAGLRTQVAQAQALQSQAQADASAARSELSQARADIARTETEKALARQQVAEARAAAEQARADQAGVEARLAAAVAERDTARKLAEELRADRETQVNQFKVLSSETLKEQGRQADAVAQQRLQATRDAMAPVEKNLAALNERLTQVEKDRSELAAGLREQVKTVVTTSENLRRETNALTTALRKPQVRGAWGELQLKRVVEISGMLDHCDFYEQASDQTTSDARIRPDMKVMLGDDKFIYVDSKVPLSAFLDAMETTDDDIRAARLQQFADNVKSHIDQLSAKEYWKSDTHSPEFVVLFIPSESLASEALAQRPTLLEYATGKNIVLASPTTLIGLLRSVAYGWKQAALADSAAEVFALGRELYDRLATMGTNFNKLGRSLQSSVNAYNSTLGSLETRVFVSARRFRDLQVTDKDFAEVKGLEQTTRLLSAPELLADAARDDDHTPTGVGPADELREIAPVQPSVAELVDEQQPSDPAPWRQLG
ncbi:DNA recombination protein RmuC [Brooklawnia cerclae]|uniref:DNA recombination protein RmuC n=1 Tax=Brooklawnia cerclae TaxID=349934 RepID=A0ABX0SH61_9ACTN|nr:DNA recombination protein RmuC [Brooklawnia cerclae]NIH57740.1 DNA recombination protein RmuC [Brooklawnia cerclae]